MTIVSSLANYLQSQGVATLGQDLIINRAPSSKEVVDDLWWIISNGGGPIQKNQTGEVRKSYTALIYRRGKNYRQIDEQMSQLEEDLNCDRCTQLEGFDTIDIEATAFPLNDDLDSEDRMVGLLQVTITTYKEC